MTSMIIGLATAATVGIILFVVNQQVLAAQTTTSWSALSITLIFLIPSILALALIIMIFRAVTGRA